MNQHNNTAHSHVDPRQGHRACVELDRDHPGFRDQAYRQRRNEIAQIALDHEPATMVPDAPYTAAENELWRGILRKLTAAHRGSACREYLRASERLQLRRDRIPQLEQVSDRVSELADFRLEPVAGLVNAKAFLSAMSSGVFLSTQYIRHYSSPSYTPEPDVVHEMIGHAVQLANPKFAALSRMFGRAAARTDDSDLLAELSRVYWYTLEFGAVREDGAVKAYGSGLLSSFGEMQRMEEVELRELDFLEMERTAYDPTGFQPVIYVAPSVGDLERALTQYLER